MKIGRKTFLRFASLPFLGLAGKKLSGLGGPQRRWAMAFDTQRCTKEEGCTRCVDACHLAHNVPHIPDRKREVKWIWKEPFRNVFRTEYATAALESKPVLAMCNHCANPPCTRVCPTGATWKRADGIVMMDWHRCIGCRYCVAGCPYGARSFNWSDPRPHIHPVNPGFPTRTKGVVEKCSFCEERLAVGKLPLCVDACPERALVFGDLNDPGSEIHRLVRSRYGLRPRAELGTDPSVFYVL
jgi:molybdopterin-containing oxidoreductase family iron-sulfur binding subunit